MAGSPLVVTIPSLPQHLVRSLETVIKFVKSNRFTFASLIEVRRSLLRTSRVNQLLLTDFSITL